MNWFKKPRSWIVVGAVIAALVLLDQFWMWEVERVEVKKHQYLVRIHLWGKNLPEDDVVAPDDSYKGVMLQTSQEGRYFLNPIFWTYDLHDRIDVPAGKCLVMTRKYGTKIPAERLLEGDILAHEGERGIVREVKLPGSYYLNPYAYDWQTVDAVNIGPDQVGVRIAKVGKDPRVGHRSQAAPLRRAGGLSRRPGDDRAQRDLLPEPVCRIDHARRGAQSPFGVVGH